MRFTRAVKLFKSERESATGKKAEAAPREIDLGHLGEITRSRTERKNSVDHPAWKMSLKKRLVLQSQRKLEIREIS